MNISVPYFTFSKDTCFPRMQGIPGRNDSLCLSPWTWSSQKGSMKTWSIATLNLPSFQRFKHSVKMIPWSVTHTQTYSSSKTKFGKYEGEKLILKIFELTLQQYFNYWKPHYCAKMSSKQKSKTSMGHMLITQAYLFANYLAQQWSHRNNFMTITKIKAMNVN